MTTASATDRGALLEQAQQAAEQKIEELAAFGLPGALVGLSLGSEDVRRFARGIANTETAAPLQIKHRMRIGSVAKAIVGTLVLQLVDEGRLSLDDPISRYVAEVPNGDRITLRMLGRHHSGLFNPLADPSFRDRINSDPGASLSASQIIDIVRSKPAAADPRDGFSYSNANTVLLAEAIEAVTGQPLSRAIEARIRRAFGVDTPVIPSTAGLPDAELRGYRYGARKGAVEYGRVFFDATGFSASWAGAAGNMNATLGDLLLLAKPLAAGITLSDQARDSLHDFESIAPGFDYGFHMARFGEAIGHAGDVPGFSSFLAWLPRHDLSIVVLCNLSNLADKRAPAEIIGRGVVEALSPPSEER